MPKIVRAEKFRFSVLTVFNNDESYYNDYHRNLHEIMIGKNSCYSREDRRSFAFPFALTENEYNIDSIRASTTIPKKNTSIFSTLRNVLILIRFSV